MCSKYYDLRMYGIHHWPRARQGLAALYRQVLANLLRCMTRHDDHVPCIDKTCRGARIVTWRHISTRAHPGGRAASGWPVETLKAMTTRLTQHRFPPNYWTPHEDERLTSHQPTTTSILLSSVGTTANSLVTSRPHGDSCQTSDWLH